MSHLTLETKLMFSPECDFPEIHPSTSGILNKKRSNVRCQGLEDYMASNESRVLHAHINAGWAKSRFNYANARIVLLPTFVEDVSSFSTNVICYWSLTLATKNAAFQFYVLVKQNWWRLTKKFNSEKSTAKSKRYNRRLQQGDSLRTSECVWRVVNYQPWQVLLFLKPQATGSKASG